MSSDFEYCMDLVRKRDRDRYWCAMLAPATHKNALFTLYAFNSEITEIGLSVTEPLIGQMRLRWWLDALEPIFAGAPPKQPVAVSLSNALNHEPHLKPLIEALLEARERDMDKSPFQTLQEAEKFAEETSGTLTEISVAVCGVADPLVLQAARNLGKCWGILGLIRSVPYHLERGSVLLPLDLCESTKFNRQAFLDHGYKGEAPPGLKECVETLRAQIDNIASTAGPLKPGDYKAPFLLKVLLNGYLHELDQAGYDPFQLDLWRKGPRLRDMMKLKWAALTKSV